MSKRIAFLTWGNGSQIRSFHDFNHLLDDMLYLRELDRHDLSQYAAVVVPDAMDSEAVRAHAAALNAYVRQGGLLVVFGGEDTAEWIDVVALEWRPIHARDWLWWTKPGTKLEIHQPEPRHPICDSISLRDMGWHWSGVFGLHPAAKSALNLDDDSASLFLDFDQLPGGGRLIVTTLDPHVHNGERFMPATKRFLEGFYPWLNRELGIVREKRGFTVTYLQCLHHETEWEPETLAPSLAPVGGVTRFLPLYELSAAALAGSDILYIPNNQDQFFLRERQEVLLGFLARGGHLIINSEPAIAWLPFLGTFEAVPPRPFSNIKVRVKDDPFGFFANMDEGFDGWCGIFGQYARGWTPAPAGAVWLTEVGPADDPKPADWLWQYPTDDGKGGWVFMHNGDNMVRYPDHGPAEAALVRDICLGLMRQVSGVVQTVERAA
ncbi:hypothetical protein VW23_017690 [Devosia insulae DS-56]|uniref:Uncharacterized protein n=1 Tax=Devosia insulae DS-56 TaxID=1116389 RepID=A0A1E5XRG9_9HYPH|nr:hypothetical protein [Devosia insulae]OEO31196.1 hypothetical protein VW23_017690 [Devosia insulae DS-56]